MYRFKIRVDPASQNTFDEAYTFSTINKQKKATSLY